MTRITPVLIGLSAVAVLGFSLGCVGGASLDSNEAGNDGWLDYTPPAASEIPALEGDGRCDWLGRPYVSVSTERVYALLNSDLQQDCGSSETIDRKVVYAIHPDVGAQALVDVSGREDVRLLDTSEGLLLMGESSGFEHLWRIDHETLEILDNDAQEVRYWGTRTSPSRRWVAAGDNTGPGLDLHIIDPRSLDGFQLSPDAAWTEAQWLEDEDQVATIAFDGSLNSARLELWDLRGIDDGADLPNAPVYSVQIDEIQPNIFGSYTWIGVDPVGPYVAYPVWDSGTGQPVVLLQDSTDGSTRRVNGVDGPLRFTPDGSTLVGWNINYPGRIELVDVVSLEVRTVDLPMEGMVEFVMGYGGNQLLVADVFGNDELVIYDLDLDESIVLPVVASLEQFAQRQDQVWMVDEERLFEVDLGEGVIEEIDLGWSPRHVVWAPVSDMLYLDDAHAPRARFMDPETLEISWEVVLDPNVVPAIDLSVDRALIIEDSQPVTALASRL